MATKIEARIAAQGICTEMFQLGFEYGVDAAKIGVEVDSDDTRKDMKRAFNEGMSHHLASPLTLEMAWGAYKAGANIGNGLVVSL